MFNPNEAISRREKLRSQAFALNAVLAKQGRDFTADEESEYKSLMAEIKTIQSALDTHAKGAHFGSPRDGAGFNFAALAEGGEDGEEDPKERYSVRNSLRSAFQSATPEQQEEIKALAGYLRGNIQASANLSPSGDGGLLIPSFVQGTLERAYAAFHPVIDVCRNFLTDTGAATVFPVVDDTEEAVQLDPTSDTGADDAVSGDTPPTALTGPTMKAYKVSSKPVYIPRELETDSDVDIVSEVVGALLARIIRFENKRYTLGTGVNQAEGFLHACSTHEGTGTLDLDNALDLAYSVPAQFRPNGVYMASDATIKYLRKLKTGLSGDHRYLWAFQDANAVKGTPALLHGYPIYPNPAMTDVSGDGSYGGGLSSPLAFGDFSKFVVRQAEQNRAYLRNYEVPRKDGRGVILFRRTDSKLLIPGAIAKLSVGTS